jgi:hypothetical protein
MNDVLFRMRVTLTNRNYGNVVLAVTAFDAYEPIPPYSHQRIDIEATLYTTDANGKRAGQKLFKRGDTWCAVNSSTAIDSEDAKELVLSTLAMKPGDTDEDYFAHYTEAQIAFAESYGETLSCEAMHRFGER